jgi:arabinose-5-phosphate isomerase
MERDRVLKIGREVFRVEAEEILKSLDLLDDSFASAVETILDSSGKVVICGMGKSGIIGRKISATLSSTGTPSFFLHPAEAYHGDLGMVEPDDTVILISNSGETDEVLKIIPFLKSQNSKTISITNNSLSTLAKNTDIHLYLGVTKEACPLQLAPTTSTTLTLVMGDALAVALMELREFKDIDFAQFHPGGSLGRRLITKVEDVMSQNNLPTAQPHTGIKEVIEIVSSGKKGLVAILKDEKLFGVITDGDIRRAMEGREQEFFSLKAEDIMTLQPKRVELGEKLIKAEELMTHHRINTLFVVQDENLVGIIELYDLGR